MIEDLTGKAGFGWQAVSEPHRCSRKFCEEPAVAMYVSECGGPWTKVRRHVRSRWTCAPHLMEYSPMWVEDGRVLADWDDRLGEIPTP